MKPCPAPRIEREAFRRLYEGGVRPSLIAHAFGLTVETVRSMASDMQLISPHGPGRPKRYDRRAIMALTESFNARDIAAVLGYPVQHVRTIISRERRR